MGSVHIPVLASSGGGWEVWSLAGWPYANILWVRVEGSTAKGRKDRIDTGEQLAVPAMPA